MNANSNTHPDASDSLNIGVRLSEMATTMPDAIAVAMPIPRQWFTRANSRDSLDRGDKRQGYRQVTFRELDDDSDAIAAGLQAMGMTRGMRITLLVRQSIDFISLVFALFKLGVVVVLVDPGMGRKRLLQCIDEVEVEGFVAIPIVHAMRVLMGRRWAKARYNLTVGRRWFWGGPTLAGLRAQAKAANLSFEPAATRGDDPAAIIFTSGATGLPKGVLYHHRTFSKQVDEIRDFYNIQPGGIDVPAFPLFGLFNAAMGVTTVIPDMDPAHPAKVDPRNIIQAIDDWKATQSFASPAVWNVVGRYCEEHDIHLPTLRQVFSSGAPVPPRVLRQMKNAIAPDGDIYTPYGATESLPVASIAASEVLGETAEKSNQGAGTCVGRKFPGIAWKVIQIDDNPIASISDVVELPTGETGELIVRGEVVTKEYIARPEANRLSKIADGDAIWHRIGDVGYLDEQDRFWFCGRKTHRVQTPHGTMYPIPCEAIFNQHERIFRSALVGVGEPGTQRPVMVLETWPHKKTTDDADRRQLIAELTLLANAHPHTERIQHFLIHPALPVDVRHNAKISREKLTLWATEQLK